MIGLDILGSTAQAVTIVGLVLVEAITLYVGYGAITRLASPAVFELLGGE
ncbi:DUF7512 family protein [Halalkalicoccus subterraneus]|nr:hypothetical protein [Halalkalicoccus subterraneus]